MGYRIKHLIDLFSKAFIDWTDDDGSIPMYLMFH